MKSVNCYSRLLTNNCHVYTAGHVIPGSVYCSVHQCVQSRKAIRKSETNVVTNGLSQISYQYFDSIISRIICDICIR